MPAKANLTFTYEMGGVKQSINVSTWRNKKLKEVLQQNAILKTSGSKISMFIYRGLQRNPNLTVQQVIGDQIEPQQIFIVLQLQGGKQFIKQ